MQETQSGVAVWTGCCYLLPHVLVTVQETQSGVAVWTGCCYLLPLVLVTVQETQSGVAVWTGYCNLLPLVLVTVQETQSGVAVWKGCYLLPFVLVTAFMHLGIRLGSYIPSACWLLLAMSATLVCSFGNNRCLFCLYIFNN